MHVCLCMCVYICVDFLLVSQVTDSDSLILIYMVCFPIFLFLACFKILHNYYNPLLVANVCHVFQNLAEVKRCKNRIIVHCGTTLYVPP